MNAHTALLIGRIILKRLHLRYSQSEAEIAEHEMACVLTKEIKKFHFPTFELKTKVDE
jgi:hypothetical protein